jgi:hypothetical protein
MTPQMPHTPAWRAYSYVSFLIGAGMLAIGILYLQADLATKGFFAIAGIHVVGAAFNLAKTLRDEHEATRLINKLDDAATDRLLREGATVR